MFGPAWLGQVPLARPRRLGATQAMTDADASLIASVQAAVVEFSSNGCVPCVQYKPVFDDVASGTGPGILMASVNIDDSPSLASVYAIEATPTTIFLASGTEVNRVQGKMTRDDLVASIFKAFGPPSQTQATPPQNPAPATPTPAAPSQSTAPQQASLPAPPAPQRAPAQNPGTPAPASSGMSSTTKALVIGGVSLTAIVIGVVLIKG